MVKMILSVPNGFNVETFGHVVTTLVNESREAAERADYDLCDFISVRLSHTPDFKEYEVGADLIDFDTIDILQKLQGICPLVTFHFENDGTPDPKPNAYDDDYFADAIYELFKAAGVKHCAFNTEKV